MIPLNTPNADLPASKHVDMFVETEKCRKTGKAKQHFGHVLVIGAGGLEHKQPNMSYRLHVFKDKTLFFYVIRSCLLNLSLFPW